MSASGPDRAMILAAGFGTRMGSLTRDCPKPMLPVAGRPMIDLALDQAEQAGVRHCVINLHYLGSTIRNHLSARPSPEILFSEETEILDTGGGVAQALPLLGNAPFFTLNSDAIFTAGNPFDRLRDAWRPEAMDALLLLVPVECALAYTRAGDFFLGADGEAPTRRENRDRAPLVYSGAQILSPSALLGTPSGAFSLNVVWDRLLAKGRLAAVTYNGNWVDVGTPDGLGMASSVLSRQAQ